MDTRVLYRHIQNSAAGTIDYLLHPSGPVGTFWILTIRSLNASAPSLNSNNNLNNFISRLPYT